jgi:hypothetical protein
MLPGATTLTKLATGAEFYEVLRRRLSPERLGPYELAAGGPEGALALYEWNIAISGAFYESLQSLEVVLRNTVDEQLTRLHARAGRPGFWYHDPAGLLELHRRVDIASARARVRQTGNAETPGQVVAELMFGFWRYLLSRRYEQSLWTPAVRHGFPHLRPQRRRAIYDRVERLNRLRNRIAHHEPIHGRDLAADYGDMLFVIRAICPATGSWIDRTSHVTRTLATRPSRS